LVKYFTFTNLIFQQNNKEDMKEKWLIAILLILLTQISKSQDVSFTANGPSTVQTGVPFNIVYTCKAPEEGRKFKAPSFNDFNFLGQSTSQSSSFSTTIINGRIKSEQSIILSWYISLEATKEGTFTIPAATVEVNGKTYSSNSLTIKVTKGLPPSQQNNSVQTPNYDDFDNIAENISSNLFLNVSTNKTSAYMGEPIFVYCKMFSAYDLNLKDFKPSTFDNFYNKELPMPQQIQAQREKINNKTFLTAVLDKRVLFAQKTGNLSIKPYQATFQLYDGWGFPAGTKKVVSNTKNINIKPLPNNKPNSFSGAVGSNFTISIDKNNFSDLNIDQTYTLTLTIKGTGNIGLFDVPQFNIPSTFEKLSPETSQNTDISENGINGTIQVKYTFIPRVPGNFSIPPFEFSFFDYQKEKYITLTTDSIKIKVNGQANSTSTASSNPSVSTTELTKDINFIKTTTKLQKFDTFIITKSIYWLLFFSLIVLFITTAILLRKYIQKQSDIAYVKLKNASKVSTKRLKKAQKLLKEKQIEQFYVELLQALWGYISDKFNIPTSELTRQNVAEKLNKINVENTKIDNLISTIDICETARYTPSLITENPNQLFDKVKNTIDSFEKIS